MKYQFALLIAVIFCAAAINAATTDIYTIGDSITASGSYQAQLDSRMGSNSLSHNLGVGGYGCPQVFSTYAANVTNGTSTTVISLCGINDAVGGVGAAAIEASIEQIYNLSVEKNNSLVLMTIGTDTSNQTICPTILAVNSWLATFASAHSVPLVDFYHVIWNGTDCIGNTSLTNPDGLHPNAAGQVALGNAVWAQAFNSTRWPSAGGTCQGATYSFACNQTVSENCTLTGDMSINDSYCLWVAYDQNVTIDCAGHSMTGNDADGQYYGVLSQRAGTTVKDCEISKFKYGIYGDGGRFTVDNVRVYHDMDGGWALRLTGDNNVIENSLTNTTVGAFSMFISGSANDTIINSTAISSTSADALSIATCSGVRVTDTTAISSGPNSNAFAISNSAGALIANCTALSYGAGASAAIGLPITGNTGIQLIGNTIHSSTRGIYIPVGYSENTTIDCQGKPLAGNPGTTGIFTQSFNSTVKNCNVSDFTDGIILGGAQSRLLDSTSNGRSSISGANSIAQNVHVSVASGIGLLIGDTASCNGTVLNGSSATSADAGSYAAYVQCSDGGAIVTNSVFSGSGNGIGISSDSGTYTGNTFSGAAGSAVSLDGASGNIFNNNAISGGADNGVSIISGSNGNTFTGNSIHGSGKAGISIAYSSNNAFVSDHLYNNRGLEVSASASPISVSASGLIFDNPSGSYAAYTNLSLNDTLTAGQNYSIAWTPSPATPLPGHMGFQNKFLNISSPSGTSIDSITWHWNDAELGGYNELEFEVWQYDSIGGWVLLNGTLDTVANTLSLLNLVPASDYGILENLTLLNDSNINALDLYGANITNSTDLARWNGTDAGNLTTEGGNITFASINGTTLTDRWAAFFGDIVGTVFLGDGASNVYSWNWSPSDGGVVCLSTNSSLNTIGSFLATGASGGDIDDGWGFGSVSDSGSNTFNGTNCSLSFQAAVLDNASYAVTGTSGDFRTCAYKTEDHVMQKNDMFFCTGIRAAGALWNGGTGNFELMVPTAFGPGASEVYYFYATLN